MATETGFSGYGFCNRPWAFMDQPKQFPELARYGVYLGLGRLFGKGEVRMVQAI